MKKILMMTFGLGLLSLASFVNAANLTTQVITSSFTPSLAAAAAPGDTYVNDGNTFLVVTNGGGAPITVTVQVQRTSIKVPDLGNVAFADIEVTVPNGASRWITVPKGPYNNTVNRVTVNYSAVTSVTVGAFKAP